MANANESSYLIDAVVTGGTRGIGKAIVSRLLPRLRSLGVVAKQSDGLAALGREIADKAPDCSFVSIEHDLSDLGGIPHALEMITAPSLDLLVLDAGVFTEGDLESIDLSDFQRDLATNLTSALVSVQALLPRLRRGRRPRIIIIGSTAAYEPYPLVPTYGIAKWGLRSFALNLRAELVKDRVGVTFLSPGGTATDMWEGEELAPNRLLEPNDIAVMLCATLDLSEQAVVDEIIVRPMLGDIHE